MAMGPITPAQLDRLYPTVGAIVIYWGLIDLTITHIALRMFKVLQLQDAHHALPTILSARLEVIKTNFKKNPALAKYKVDVLQVIGNIKEMQQLRDMIAHGAASGYDPKRDAIQFTRIDRLKPGQKRQAKSPTVSHQFNRMPVAFATLTETSDRALRINTFLDSLLKELERLSGVEREK